MFPLNRGINVVPCLLLLIALWLLEQNTLNTALKDIQDQNETLQFQHDEGEPADATWC